MKTKLFLSATCLTFMMCFSLQSIAQIAKAFDDTMMVFKTPLEFAQGEKLIRAGIGLEFKPGQTFHIISASKARKLVLPRTTKRLPQPTILRQNRSCFEFSCDPSCGSCFLIWVDHNRDGKVQALQEIRCITGLGQSINNTNIGQSRTVVVKKVNCQ